MFRPAADGNIFASHSSLDEVLQRSEYRTAVLVVFGLLYSLVAYIHIKHTGYALAAMRLVQGLKRDRAQMDEGLAGNKFDRKPNSQRINLGEFVRQLEEAKDPVYASLAAETRLSSAVEKGLHTQLSSEQRDAIAPHSISTEEDGDAYRLNALGILTDKQLKAWVDMQPTDLAKMAVALYGHSLQIRFIPGGTDIDIDIKDKRNK